MLELSPTDDYAHYALGRALEKQGRDAEANGHYKLASSLRPGDERYADRIMDLEPPRASEAPCVQRSSQRLASVRVDGVVARRDRRRPARPARRRRRRRRATTPSGSPARSRACASSRTRTAASTARCSTPAARRSSSASSRCSPTRAKGNRPSFTRCGAARSSRAALRALLRGAARARRPGRDGRLRRAHGGRARQRRAGHDRPRRADVGYRRASMPQLNAIGIVVSDMERSIAFYRLLGLDVPETPDEGHVDTFLPNGVRFMLDSEETVTQLPAGLVARAGEPARARLRVRQRGRGRRGLRPRRRPPASTARRSRGTRSGASATRSCRIRTACRSTSTPPSE